MMSPNIDRLHHSYINGTASVTDIISRQLKQIQALQPTLSAYVSWDPQIALTTAHQQDVWLQDQKNRRTGHNTKTTLLPPLFGVSISIKDNIDVAGMKTTASSFSQLHHPASTRDAETVRRLRTAGAIIIGKANCHELAFGGPSFDLPTPPATNPWKNGYFPGGSSSGSGTTVAAGLCTASLGTDTAGSIRSPSTHCGLVGLKPTNGAVPLDGVKTLSLTMDHVGPLAVSVSDCERIYRVLHTAPHYIPASGTGFSMHFQETKNIASGPARQRIRLGIPLPDWGLDALLSPDSLVLFQNALTQLKNSGIMLVPLSLPSLQAMHVCSAIIMMAEVAYVFGPDVRANFNQYGQVFRSRVLVGERIPASAYLQACQDRLRLQNQLAQCLQGVDALILPGATSTAGPLNQVDTFYFLTEPNLNAIANLSGQPALAMPTTICHDGVPFGIQLLGKHHQEDALFNTAHDIENIFQFEDHRERHFASITTRHNGDKP